jgi:hypothetical protein
MPVFEGVLSNLTYNRLVWTCCSICAPGTLWPSFVFTQTHPSNCWISSHACWASFASRLCSQYKTYGSDCKMHARMDRAQKQGKQTDSGRCKECSFNMSTYKFHALGDYIQFICLFGTTDGWTTQTVSILHRCTAVLIRGLLARASLSTSA